MKSLSKDCSHLGVVKNMTCCYSIHMDVTRSADPKITKDIVKYDLQT